MAQKDIADQYKKISPHEHILLRPDSYIGAISLSDEFMLLPIKQNNGKVRFERRKIKYVKSLYKIVDEIIVNCRDQYIRLKDTGSSKKKVHMVDKIDITVNQETGYITVLNTGEGIPVERHPEEDVMIPDLIFGYLLTSSNYDDSEERYVGGKNGFGAKLTNIYSKEFILETVDARRKKLYCRTYFDNM